MCFFSRDDVRKSAGVLVFASTQFSGWYALKMVTYKIGTFEKPHLLNWTTNCHEISTIYAGMNIPEKDRELFYKHIGHSAAIINCVWMNKNSSPKSMTKVLPFMEDYV